MRWLILKVIGTLGRFTVLPLIGVAVLLLAAWGAALDAKPIYAIAAVPLVFLLIVISGALFLGMFYAGLRSPPGPFATRAEAPGLWRMWDELSPPRWWQLRRLRLDDNFNASIGQRSRLLGLALPETTMTFGLPMLQALDEPMVRAVVAHEVGHDACRHTVGLSNIIEFERALYEVFESFPPHTTVTGSVLFGLLGRLGDWLKTEELRLSRVTEHEADAVAAKAIGRDAFAASLAVFSASAERYKTDFVTAAHDNLVQLLHVPPSPLERLLAEPKRPSADDLKRYAEVAYAMPHDPASTHPVLSESLTAIGVTSLPTLPEPGPSALTALLTPDVVAKLMKIYRQRWERYVSHYLQLG